MFLYVVCVHEKQKLEPTFSVVLDSLFEKFPRTVNPSEIPKKESPMAFFQEPSAYHKTALSELQGAWQNLRDAVVEKHPR